MKYINITPKYSILTGKFVGPMHCKASQNLIEHVWETLNNKVKDEVMDEVTRHCRENWLW